MMYNNKMVAVIKVGGKILREVGDTVYIPFGSEYSIHFSNHNGVSAAVEVSIDGEDVLDGHTLIVRSGNEGKVEGFLRGSAVSHKFKFIEKTEQISEHRGDKISDGLIRISYRFEKPKLETYGGGLTYPQGVRGISKGTTGGGYVHNGSSSIRYGTTLNSFSSSLKSTRSVSTDESLARGIDIPPQNDSGITVNGSSSDQSFSTGSLGALEQQEHVIVFQLKGETDKGFVPEPVLVKTKLVCDTCGTSSKSNMKFCSNCGTSLVI